jgi:hypothetical protein
MKNERSQAEVCSEWNLMTVVFRVQPWWLCCVPNGTWWLCCVPSGTWWLCCVPSATWWLCCICSAQRAVQSAVLFSVNCNCCLRFFVNFVFIVSFPHGRILDVRLITSVFLFVSTPTAQKYDSDDSPKPVPSTSYPHPISSTSILTLSFHFILGLPSRHLRRGFPTEILDTLFSSPSDLHIQSISVSWFLYPKHSRCCSV